MIILLYCNCRWPLQEMQGIIMYHCNLMQFQCGISVKPIITVIIIIVGPVGIKFRFPFHHIDSTAVEPRLYRKVLLSW